MAKSEHVKMGKEYANLTRTALTNAAGCRTPENSVRYIRLAITNLKHALKEYAKETTDATKGQS